MKEFEAKVFKLINEISDFREGLFGGLTNLEYFDLSDEESETIENSGIKFERVEQVGGEGQGEIYYAVIKFSDNANTCYVQLDGTYYSYDGATFDSAFIVEPRQVTLTKYFRV